MDCSTCGAPVPAGHAECATCGSQVAIRTLPGGRGEANTPAWIPALALCPRCGYRGEGLPFFSRGTHSVALVLAAVLTAPFLGAGGVAFYLLRRFHRVCPRCGRSWRPGAHALVRSDEASVSVPPTLPMGREGALRNGSILLWIVAALLLLGGVFGGEWAAVLGATMAAIGGWATHRAAGRERATRRDALLARLQPPVLRLAAERGGRLTVTQAAAELGWTLRRAERVLASLDDGFRVSSEVTDEGVIVYEFRELTHLP